MEGAFISPHLAHAKIAAGILQAERNFCQVAFRLGDGILCVVSNNGIRNTNYDS